MMKDVPGYEGMYKINESGVVVNSNGHPLRYALSNSGYLRVAFEPKDNESSRKNKSIHRLVAETFIPNPDNLPVVMHLDNDPLNNHVSNLKWGTQSENIKQAFDEGRKTMPNQNPKIIRPVSKLACGYDVYNEDTGDVIHCRSRSETAELIGYKEISLKNMVGHERGITLGPYKGYKIKRTEKIDSPLSKYCI